MKSLVPLLCFILFSNLSRAQLVITDEPSALALVQRLVGSGVSVSNVVFTGDPLMAGRFKNNSLTNIGLDSGIVLTTGSAKTIPSFFVTGLDGDGVVQAISTLADTDWFLPGDADLATAAGGPLLNWYDACVLEFDFIPSGDTISFRYVLSSEEYTPAYVCTYNDAFAFFLSGPGIPGTRNIALVPGTATPVSIINVNNVANLCPSYPAYYVDNELNRYFTHDGHTTVLTAQSPVVPCSTYHLKIVIADYLDGLLDSGVFLEDKSLSSNEPPTLDSVSTSASCGGTQITVNFSEPILCNSIQSADFSVSGPGGPYTVTSWSAPLCATGAQGTQQMTLTINPALATNGNYQVCLTNLTGSVADFCGNLAPPLCLPISVATTVPVFNAIPAFCAGSQSPVLPGSSNNGVTGTWSPAVVNNTTSGTYVFTPAAGQCAVPVSVPITVSNGGTSSTAVTVCTNALPYSWNGNSYASSGTYTVNLTLPNGCDSVATLILSANSVVTGVEFITICSNQFPYSWNGNTYSAPGSYTTTLVASSGCDSIVTLTIAENSVAISNTAVSLCNNQFPYSWNGNNYTAPGTYSVNLTSSAGCDSIATLILASNAVSSSTTPVSICSSQLPYTWNGNTYSVAGTYTVNLTGSTGCDSLATLILTANATSASTTSVSICNNQLPYSWNGNVYNASGTFSVTLVGSAGCDSLATLVLTTGAVSTSSTAISVCNNQLPYTWNGNVYSAAGTFAVTLLGSSGCDSIATLVLSANAPTSSLTPVTVCSTDLPYSWNGNIYPVAGNYVITLTNSAGCDSVATLQLTANANSSSTTAISVCSNQLPYAWNGTSFTTAGTYVVNLVNSLGCDSLATLILNANTTSASNTSVSICGNQFPYSWNGNIYAAAGTYTVNLVNSAGCDSLATLILDANAISSSTTAVSLCSDQFPYAWNGNSYAAGGTYTVTLVNSFGCDSLATLVLNSNAQSASTTSAAVCSDQLPYLWNGNAYPAAGTYTVNLTNSAGCDSIATLVLVTGMPSTSTTAAAVCNNNFPFTWNGIAYNAAGTYTLNLTNSSGCDSVATLILSSGAASASTTNLSICTDQFPFAWNGNTYTAAGNYTASLINSSGCDSVANLVLTANSTSATTTSLFICNNQLPYTWNGNSYTSSGTYSVTLTNSTGCDSVATLVLSAGPTSLSTTTVSLCNSDLPYIWNGNSYTTGGTYSVNLIGTSGCDSIASLVLNAQTTPIIPSVISPVSYCQFDVSSPLSATASPAGNQLLWFTTATGGTGSTTIPVPTTAAVGVFEFYVCQTNGCEGPRERIVVNVKSTPQLGPDQSVRICAGGSADIRTLFSGGGNPLIWTDNSGNPFNPALLNTAGMYLVSCSTPEGCTDSASITMIINPPVYANAGPDSTIETNTAYQLNGVGNLYYQWAPGGPLSNPFISNPIATLDHDQTFILTTSDDIGCFARDTVHLRVLDGPTFYVPGAFTPNGDGLNDQFQPSTVGIQSIRFFRVYNRLGELVFETNSIRHGWDGTYKGKRQGIGNYVWTIAGTDRFGVEKILKGNVILIR